jgi:hypothetical protein
MPAFSPIAAKPSARLHEVVDLPTPPLPEATAMTCLTPGMPAAFEVGYEIHPRSRSRDLVINNNLSAALTYKFPHAIRSQSQFRYVSGAI